MRAEHVTQTEANWVEGLLSSTLSRLCLSKKLLIKQLGPDVIVMTIKSISKCRGINYTHNNFLGQNVQIIQTRPLWV
jgi:hypothetical protein